MALDNPSPHEAERSMIRFHESVPDSLFRYLLSTIGVTSVSGLMSRAASIDFNSNNITDISGIEYAKGLTSLYLYGCNISVPVDVSELVDITVLHFSNNSLPSIGSLAYSVNLTSLYLLGNEIDQPTLEQIVDDLWANRVVLGAAGCVIDLRTNPGSTATATSKASEISDLITAGCTVTI